MIPDCWLLALSFLAADDLSHCLAVSRHLQALATTPRLWQRVRVACSEDLVQRATHRQSSPHPLFFHLTHLTIRVYRHVNVLQHLPAIRSLAMECPGDARTLPDLPHLLRLDAQCFIATRVALSHLSTATPQLQHMTIGGEWVHSQQPVDDRPVDEPFQSLESLEIVPFGYLTRHVVREYGPWKHWAPHLRQLTVRMDGLHRAGNGYVHERRVFIRGLANVLPHVREVRAVSLLEDLEQDDSRVMDEGAGYRERRRTESVDAGACCEETLSVERWAADPLPPLKTPATQ
jgi:hypothetical protein